MRAKRLTPMPSVFCLCLCLCFWYCDKVWPSIHNLTAWKLDIDQIRLLIMLCAFSGFGVISRLPMGIFRILKRPNHLEMVGLFQDFGQSRNGPRAFSGFWNSPAPFRILRLPRTFLRLPKGIFTIEALYYWPLIENHTMGIQRYHFDLLRWPLLGVLSPPPMHCLNFVHISKIALIIIILIIFL